MEQVNKLEKNTVVDGKYRIIDFLGEGGIAYNYLARMLKPPYVKVVLKQTKRVQVLNDEISDDRFQMEREYRLLHELNHPGIPRVFDMFEVDNIVYFAREYRDGVLMEDLIKQGMEKTVIEKASWQILDILNYLHQYEIIYRDLKPSNILIDENGRAFLFDFGTARFHNPNKNKDTIALGTPGFAAPEQYGKRQTDERADIYSFGALLYYMTTGDNPEKRPFEIGEEGNLQEKIEDPGFRSILKRCLELDPDKRYFNVSEVKKAILGRGLFKRISTVYTNFSGRSYVRTKAPYQMRIGLLIFALILFISSNFSYIFNRRSFRTCGGVKSIPANYSPVSLGDIKASQGNWKEALGYYELALKQGRLNREDYLKLSAAYYNNKKYSEALKILNGYIDKNPNVYNAYRIRAMIQDKLGHYDAAINDMNKYLKINENAQGFLFRSTIYYHKEEFQKAIMDLERAKELNPSMEAIYTNLGFVYIAMGDYDKARENLNKSISINPRRNYAYVLRAWLNIFEDRYECAKKDLMQPQRPDEKYSDVHTAQALIAVLENDMEAFYRHINDAYAYDPSNADIFYVGAMEQLNNRGKKTGKNLEYTPVFKGANDTGKTTALRFMLKAAKEDINGSGFIWYRQAAKFSKNHRVRKLAGELVELDKKITKMTNSGRYNREKEENRNKVEDNNNQGITL